jgi:hypothetical protein
LSDGDSFGHGTEEYLVGYECDGAVFDRAALADGCPLVASGEDGTPGSFLILGVADVRAEGWGFGNGAATMGVHTGEATTGSGTVFNAATTDWARLLGERHPVVERITANVLDRLSGRRRPLNWGSGAPRACG